MADEKSKDWEEAWPPEKIRRQSAEWNLAGDAGLLLYLRQTSTSLITKLDQTKKQLGDLSDETQKTIIRLDTSINEFACLANNQFIENRVYDDDTKPNRDKKNQQETPKTKEQREAELVSTMKQALDTGCGVLDSHFAKVEVRPLDFDEDDDPTFIPQPLFEPKDLYGIRPLPHVIGTAEFMRSDFIGLKEDEDEMQSKKMEEVLSESEDEAAPAPIPQRAIPQQSGLIPAVTKPITVAGSPSMDEKGTSDSSSSGLFGTSVDSGENAFMGGGSDSQKDTDFRSELTKKLTAGNIAANAKQEIPKQSTAPMAKPASGSARIATDAEEDILFSPPPLLPRDKKQEESDDEGGLFKPRTRGLFDNDDDDPEENRWNSLPRGRLQKLANPGKDATPKRDLEPIATGTKSNSTASLQVSTGSTIPSESPTPGAIAPSITTAAQQRSGSMFADDEEDDDDLFGKAYKKPTTAQRDLPTSTRPSVEESSKKPLAVVPPAKQSVRSIGGGGAALFGDDEDEDDLFTILRRPKQQTASKGQSLFGEDRTASDGSTETPKITPHPAIVKENAADNSTTAKVDVTSKTMEPAIEPALSSQPPSIGTAVRQPVKKLSVPNAGGGLFGDEESDDGIFPSYSKPPATRTSETASGSGETIPKQDFRSELAKKLLAGPKQGGLVKATREPEEPCEHDSQESSPTVVPPLPVQKTASNDDDNSRTPLGGQLLGNCGVSGMVDDAISNDFDSAATKTVDTLPCLQKNRAKLPNRRPPSKHASPVSAHQQNGFGDSTAAADILSPEKKMVEASVSQLPIDPDPLGAGADLMVSTSKPEEKALPKPSPTEKKESKLDVKTKNASILFDDDDNDDLFGIISKTRPTTTNASTNGNVEQQRNTPAVPAINEKKLATKTPAKSGSVLFNDDDDDDLFSDLKRPTAKTVAKSAAADADIFSEPKRPNPTPAKTISSSVQPSNLKKGKSLFDDDDDDIDIFR